MRDDKVWTRSVAVAGLQVEGRSVSQSIASSFLVGTTKKVVVVSPEVGGLRRTCSRGKIAVGSVGLLAKPVGDWRLVPLQQELGRPASIVPEQAGLIWSSTWKRKPRAGFKI